MNKQDFFVTYIEQEAYNLGGQLALEQVRSHVKPLEDVTGRPFYVVVVDAPEAMDRAIVIRQRMFGF